MKEHIKELNRIIIQYAEVTQELLSELKKYAEKYGYLESQKEGEDDCLCHLGEPLKKGCINYKEEPKCSCAIDNVGGNCKWCKV